MTKTATTHKGYKVTYDTATHYRIFVRQYDEELKTVSWQFRGAWVDFVVADDVRYQLRRDEYKYRLIVPGDDDPGDSNGTAQDRKDYERVVTETSND